jgi:hypothetical protein
MHIDILKQNVAVRHRQHRRRLAVQECANRRIMVLSGSTSHGSSDLFAMRSGSTPTM